MNTLPPPGPSEPLKDMVREAASEVAQEATDRAAQAAHRQARQRRRRVLQSRLPLAGLLLATGLVWLFQAWGRYGHSPDFSQGREVLLELAAQKVREHVQLTGRIPADVASLLPVAAEVSLLVAADSVLLRLTEPDGRQHELRIPLSPQERP